jgi:hypothetical protein
MNCWVQLGSSALGAKQDMARNTEARNTEETERPTEWLRRLQEDSNCYRELVLEAGGLPLAAYRLARARCRVQSVANSLPTVSELMSAAREIWQRVEPSAPEPILALVLAECEFSGVTVIRPIARAA